MFKTKLYLSQSWLLLWKQKVKKQQQNSPLNIDIYYCVSDTEETSHVIQR
jgi:hypothetical protein